MRSKKVIFPKFILPAGIIMLALFILPSLLTKETASLPASLPEAHANADNSNTALAEAITGLSNADSTRYSLYAAYPQESREPYIYQSEPMRSASMIKVFLLADAMEKVRDGQLALNTGITLHSKDKVGGAGVLCGYASGTVLPLDTVLRLMITESDNTATNLIIDLLGMDDINAYIRRNGYNDTTLARKMMDFAAVNAGRDNYTSVTDLGNIFQRIYNHECVGYEQDEIMLSYLKGQTDTECFPAALPGAVIAHKTGELGGLYDDGGIIYQNGRAIILVIMTEHYSNRYRAIETMKAMAQSVMAN
ncbi:serine hydrolase [Selenomonas ruminantium]|uniref:Beta-lactamase class A n=1 Tax=Selenomonas ruminantium TaxID=971 RepID=A0A1H0MSE3_SELRU|nr:serine hydrolase [Selenomonas ruminantium]SDO83369.1 beta-lactamase class A [Selenomonas ruminantium]